jgi:cysteine-rich repeat protein
MQSPSQRQAMNRATPEPLPAPAIFLVVTFALLACTALGSCFFETKTTLCEASGLRCKPGQTCAAFQPACIDEGGCGDGVRSPDEACDDGNILDGDGCSARCDSNEGCGNGVLDTAAGEECDPSIPGTTNCSPRCILQVCGNRVLDPGERCDDGNQLDGDGCRADCMSNEACGNNVLDEHLDEQCEFSESPFPQPPTDTRTCDSDCTFPVCGDGHVNPEFTNPATMAKEVCDPGAMDSATCDNDCTAVSCGDGHLNHAADEECDLGTGIGGNSNEAAFGCRTDCRNAYCGDGVIDKHAPVPLPTDEVCDDHNLNANDDCPTGVPNSGPNPGCRPAACRDGFWNQFGANPEECDAGMGCGSGRRCNSSCHCEDIPDNDD